MNERLEISNFGPIKSAFIEVKKYTVFIGESSSGKSIIMKILAFCKWLQKRAILYDVAYNKYYYYSFNLLRKSQLDQFISEYTNIVYEGECFRIEISGMSIIKCIKIADNNQSLDKVLFISDDRFIVPILEDGTPIKGKVPYYAMNTYDSFREAIGKKDINIIEQDINTDYKKAEYVEKFNSLVLEYGLGTQATLDKEKTVIKSKDGSLVDFYNASSGIKSTGVIQAVLENTIKDTNNSSTIKNFIDITYTEELDSVESKKELGERLENVFLNRVFNVFLEEPELSLFPTHQDKLMKYLINKNLNYIFSTHSPYIISALNNLIKADEIIRKYPDKIDKVKKIMQMNNFININEINAYLLDNGTANNIMDYEYGLIASSKIDEVGECMSLVYDELLELLYD